MPIAVRQAEVVWDGTLAGGAGVVSSGSGAFDLPVTWAARTEQPDAKTSPEELIAAAHASCFGMALALVLGENHTPPERLAVTAACTLDEVDGAPRITTAELTVRARVPSLDKAGVERSVAQAGDLCPSRTRCAVTSRSPCTKKSTRADPVPDRRLRAGPRLRSGRGWTRRRHGRP